jgi:hypothetical protein
MVRSTTSATLRDADLSGDGSSAAACLSDVEISCDSEWLDASLSLAAARIATALPRNEETMRSFVFAAVALTLACTTACAAPVAVNGFKVNAMEWTDAQEKVVSRAAFDMKCAKDQLQLTVVQVGDSVDFSGGHFPQQVGVTGCGQSVVYVRSPAGWLANSSSQDSKPSETRTTAAVQ